MFRDIETAVKEVWYEITELPNAIWNNFSSTLTSLGDTLFSIGTLVNQLPTKIYERFEDFFKGLYDGLEIWISNVKKAITGLPTTILDGIKDIFIPDTEDIESSFENFLEEMTLRFGFQADFLKDFFNHEQTLEDTKVDYNINGVGTLKLTIFDSSYLKQGIIYFRPYIRGFLVLMMFFFSVKMTLSFIRQDAGVVTGKAVSHSTKKED